MTVAPQRRTKKTNLPHVQGHTATHYSLRPSISRHTRVTYRPVRPSRRPLPSLPPNHNPNSTEEDNNDDSNSVNLDDGNHDFDSSYFSTLVVGQWDDVMTQLASEYVRYKYSEEEYESGSGRDASGPDANGPNENGPNAMGARPTPKPDPRDIEIPVQEDCSCGRKNTRPILIFFLHHAARIEVNFCPCIPDAVRLMSLGLMPASPKFPRTALHLSVMEFLLELRDTPALSGTMMATLYNNLNKNAEYKMAATICQNLIPLYLELLENVEDQIERIAEGYKDNHFSCPTCPEIPTAENPWFRCMDGYMSLKCEKAQNGPMTQSKVMEDCLSTLWIDPKVVEKYNNGRNKNKRNQPNADIQMDSRFRAGGTSNRKRKKYPVNGVFGVLCRHEITHKMADITTAGESYKYPLAVVDQLLGNADGKSADDCPNINLHPLCSTN